jgi:hypothetical protein
MDSDRIDTLISLMGADVQQRMVREIFETITMEERAQLHAWAIEKMKEEIQRQVPAAVTSTLRSWVHEKCVQLLTGEKWGKAVGMTTQGVQKALDAITTEESIAGLVNDLAPPKIKAEIQRIVQEAVRRMR